MKITFTVILCCLAIITYSQDTTGAIPSIKFNPNIDLENVNLDNSEDEADSNHPDVLKKDLGKGVEFGKTRSFFTDIIIGTLITLGGFLIFWFFRRQKQTTKEDIDNE